MSQLTVVAKIIARPDAIESIKPELLKLVEPTRAESGCINYTLHQDNADPAVFIFYETWENKAALEGHMNSDHFKSYIAAVDGMIQDKAVHLMTRIA